MGKRFFYVSGIIVLVALSIIYINQRYFFNPFDFTKDRITSHNWSDYQRPLTMTYIDFKEERKSYKIENEQKIREVLAALKNSSNMNKNAADGELQGGLTLKSNNDNLLQVLFYSNHWEILKNDAKKFKISEPLENLVINKY
ncbi:hypothetical protein MUN89_18385 [Halobacillus salinarum]|uniref:Uncharacterized protein n=1 Tax=Halobacillus salinarum TaxID=2932257 RepID=A0ABY4EH75_9BACI|nr:hypothetical protein [Halobacillus salinarum]UOQ43825.1 hypothetical protein MUN89_18385 [Halobacillus salinarum]